MQVCYDRCSEILREQGWLVLMQGEKRREQLLAEFIEHGNAVLFAVNSFWEGVDVPGDALSLVVLVKLPFAVPTEPIHQARMEALQKQGKDPFDNYTLPQAVLRLKQGFGRLIRTKQDTGVIAVLDKRILTKRYGNRFLRDLPPAPKLHNLEDVAGFFGILDQAQRSREAGMEFIFPVPDKSSSPRRGSDRGTRGNEGTVHNTQGSSSLVDEDGWWLPDEDHGLSVRSSQRQFGSSGRSVQSADGIVFDDLTAGEEPENQETGRKPKPKKL
jgi:hypothetical protein